MLEFHITQLSNKELFLNTVLLMKKKKKKKKAIGEFQWIMQNHMSKKKVILNLKEMSVGSRESLLCVDHFMRSQP